MKLTIKPEYAALLPAHTEEELSELTDSLILEGVREKIIHNSIGIILDGMTRFDVANANKLDYETTQLDLADEHAERDWILKNQLGRRNLTPEKMSYLRGKLYGERVGPNGGGRAHIDLISGSESPNEDDSCQSGGIRVADQIAEETGVSAGVVQRDAKKAAIIDKLPQEIRDQHLSGAAKLSLKQLETLDKCERIGELGRAIRVGQAKDIFEAYSINIGKPLKASRKKKDPETVEETAEVEENEEPVELSIEEKMKAANREIERFCKAILKDFQAGLATLGFGNPWIQLHGRDDTAESGLRSGLKTLRSCKGAAVCPKCEGDGCEACLQSGFVDKETQSQLGS